MKSKKDGLNHKQAAFVQEYLIDRNGKQAAIRAGYAPKNAEITASKLLRLAKVDRVVTSELERMADKFKVSRERNVKELARMAYYNLQDFYDEDGALIPIHELPRDVAACLTSLEVREVYGKDGMGKPGGATALLKKIKCADKKGAVEALNKMQGYNIEKPAEQTHFHITWGGDQGDKDKPIDVTPTPTPLPANLNKVGEVEED
jgi:phage terminase small subunit